MRLLKTQVIVNPESNHGRTRQRWEQIKEALKAFLKEYKYEFTEKPQQAIEISRSAIKDGTELIVGVGGDGTINEIANGFYENRSIINPETTLGVFPSGTGCDFSRSLNIPSGYKNTMEVITGPTSTNVDVGQITYLDHQGEEKNRYFLNITDFGMGGEVVEYMNATRMKKKAASYFKSVITTFMRYRSKRLGIRIDGKEIPVDDYMIGAVANGKIFGKGMKIAPNAQLTDGLFDFVLIQKMNKFEFFKNFLRLYKGTHLGHPKVSHYLGRRIEAWPENPDEKVLIEVDGEQLGKLPASFEILPQGIPIKGCL
ncbi:diacylglycerol/lipid kinase family protein [Acidobacteriota bacterium]